MHQGTPIFTSYWLLSFQQFSTVSRNYFIKICQKLTLNCHCLDTTCNGTLLTSALLSVAEYYISAMATVSMKVYSSCRFECSFGISYVVACNYTDSDPFGCQCFVWLECSFVGIGPGDYMSISV